MCLGKKYALNQKSLELLLTLREDMNAPLLKIKHYHIQMHVFK